MDFTGPQYRELGTGGKGKVETDFIFWVSNLGLGDEGCMREKALRKEVANPGEARRNDCQIGTVEMDAMNRMINEVFDRLVE
jgi:hypothetical protein